MTVWALNACRAHPLGGGWVWACRRMIDACIEQSRREKKGRVHRLNCDAQRPNGQKDSRSEMSTGTPERRRFGQR
ncbi:hypothetical protein CWO91_37700 [Bradyrhizobium genosp. SA-3]|nr:hypothetical protein CWO91_37700 [Bradyrhizobium genosp. SA-3]